MTWRVEDFSEVGFSRSILGQISIPSEKVAYVLAIDGIDLPYLLKYELK